MLDPGPYRKRPLCFLPVATVPALEVGAGCAVANATHSKKFALQIGAAGWLYVVSRNLLNVGTIEKPDSLTVAHNTGKGSGLFLF